MSDDVQAKLARLAQLEQTVSSLRHDLRGILSPALLMVDRLLTHPDPRIVRAGEVVASAIQRAEARLKETKDPALDPP